MISKIMNIDYRKYLFLIFIILFLIPVPTDAYESKSQNKTDDKTSKTDDTRSSIAKQIEKKYGLVEDEAVNSRVEKISAQLMSILNDDEKIKDRKITFKVLNDKEINAFALPSGEIYFFKGLVDITKTDDQLASVMAHELAHIIKKHSKKMSKKATPYVVGGALLALLTGEFAAAMAGEWVASAQAESYGRKAEEEADKYGMDLLVRAGYSPIGMLQFMSFMLEEEKRRPELFQNYFFTHPFADERLETLKIITREKGFKVPEYLYRSYLESGITAHEEKGVQLVDITFGGKVIFTIAGKDEKELLNRAVKITSTLDSLIQAGVRDFDFTLVKDDSSSWIQARGQKLYEPSDSDVENSGLSRDEFLKNILAKIKKLIWEERLKRRI